jgi:hypothetical protein
MKKVLFLLLLAFMSFQFQAIAQQGQDQTSKKQWRQHQRIKDGRENGDLTRRETKTLRKQQRHIQRQKRKAAADGQITPGEKARVNKAQRRASRNIARKKHNARTQ